MDMEGLLDDEDPDNQIATSEGCQTFDGNLRRYNPLAAATAGFDHAAFDPTAYLGQENIYACSPQQCVPQWTDCHSTQPSPVYIDNGSAGPYPVPSPAQPLTRFLEGQDQDTFVHRTRQYHFVTPNPPRGLELFPPNARSMSSSIGPQSDQGAFAVAPPLPSPDTSGSFTLNGRGRSVSFSTCAQTSLQSPSERLPFSSASPHSLGRNRQGLRGKRKQLEQPAGSLNCVVCRIKFSTHSQFRKHELQHVRPFTCDLPHCKKNTHGFSTQNDLARHVASVHHIFAGNLKVYICSWKDCSQGRKLWPRLDNFDSHVQKVHKLDKSDCRNYPARYDFVKSCERSVPPDGWDLSEVHKDMDYQWLLNQHTNPFPIEKTTRGDAASSNTPRIVIDSSPIFDGKSSMDDGDQSYQIWGADTAQTQYCGSYSEASAEEGLHHQQTFTSAGWNDHLTLSEGIVNAGAGMRNDTSASMDWTSPQPSNVAQSQDVALIGDSFQFELKSQDAASSSAQESSADRTFQFIRDLTQHVAGQLREIGDVSVTSAFIEEKVSELVSSCMPTLQDSEMPTVSEPTERYLESTEMMQNNGAMMQGDLAFICDHQDCRKKFNSKAKLTKHIKRHKQQYGCTFASCTQQFGSKSDWKRHENTKHYSNNVWLCNLPRQTTPTRSDSWGTGDIQCHPIKDRADFCGQKFYHRHNFTEHLQKHHCIMDKETMSRVADRQRIGANHQGSFWCGFCCQCLKLEKKREEAWEERFKHIERHFVAEKRFYGDWVPPGETMTKTEIENSKKSPSDSDADPRQTSCEVRGKTEENPIDLTSSPNINRQAASRLTNLNSETVFCTVAEGLTTFKALISVLAEECMSEWVDDARRRDLFRALTGWCGSLSRDICFIL